MPRFLPKGSLMDKVPPRCCKMVLPGKYGVLYRIIFEGNVYYEIISTSSPEVIYRTESYFFAVRRHQETNEE